MASGMQSAWRRTQRVYDRVFDMLSARPLGIVVFAASVLLLVYLEIGLHASIRAEAVASAQQVDHPARVDSFVANVYVQPGDAVATGAPLVDLSPHFIERELARIDTEIEKLLEEAKLAQARLMVEEQRWVAPEMRSSPDRPSLEGPTGALYARALGVLQTRRQQLLEDREALTIKASRPGRVVMVAAPGASVASGSSVATVNPEYATELVAYVPADTPVDRIRAGTRVRIVRSSANCGGMVEVQRRGAGVEEAPGQLRSLFRFQVHGTPVYMPVPEDCALGVGQVLTVEFPAAVM